MVENFLVDWKLILSIENFFTHREFFCRSRIFWLIDNFLPVENFLSIENFFVDREISCQSRNFFVDREIFFVDREISCQSRNFFVDWEISCRSRIFPSIDKLESVFRYPSEGGHLRRDKLKQTMFLWANLSSLVCWQLLVIRGLARVFLRAALRLTRTSRRLALDSHFASLRACLRSTEKRKKIMPVRSPLLGLLACFAGISSIKWYSPSSINHCLTRCWNWEKKHSHF